MPKNLSIAVVITLSFLFFYSKVSAISTTDFDRKDINDIGRVALADIDGDGLKDIVFHRWAPNRASAGQKSTLSWFKYPGLQETEIADDFYFGDDIESYDINNDGKNDIVAQITNGSNRDATTVLVYLQNSPTNWQRVVVGSYNGGSEIRDFSIHDFDNDGKLDIMGRYATKLVVWYQDNPTSYTQKIVSNMNTGGAAEGLDILDIDKDGKTDAIMEGYWLKNKGGRNTGWDRYNFDPIWYTDEANNYRGYSVKVYVGDIDGDGAKDWALSDSENPDQPIKWYKVKNGQDPKSGPAAFDKTTVVNNTGFEAHTLALADFDGDCDLDVMSGGLPRTANYNVTLYLNNGDGSNFEKVTLAGTGKTYSGKSADLNGDGAPDMVIPAGWDKSENEGRYLQSNEIRTKVFTNKLAACSANPTPTIIQDPTPTVTPVNNYDPKFDLDGDEDNDIFDLIDLIEFLFK